MWVKKKKSTNAKLSLRKMKKEKHWSIDLPLKFRNFNDYVDDSQQFAHIALFEHLRPKNVWLKEYLLRVKSHTMHFSYLNPRKLNADIHFRERFIIYRQL